MTTIAIHQPNYLPYIGFFHKILISDIFIIYDDAQYSRKDFHRRNRIKINSKQKWLSVPLIGSSFNKINEMRINNNIEWQKEHWKFINISYEKSSYFPEIIDAFYDIYHKEYKYLIDINMDLIFKLMDILDLDNNKIVFSSKMNLKKTKVDRLIEMIKKKEGTTYFSGIGGKNYIDETLFLENNINLIYQKFDHPIYKQIKGDFIPNLSIIDMLFNCGEEYTKNKLREL